VVGTLAPASTFYFAEGTTRPGFDPYFTIQNPGQATAEGQITYLLGDATQQTQAFSVPANSRLTVRVVDFLGSANDSAHDFSARVETINGTEINCERPMYFNYTFAGGSWTGGHIALGALHPQASWLFAEGSTRPDFDPYLTIQNPGQAEAQVEITYLKGDATSQTQTLNVTAGSRATVRVRDVLGSAFDVAHDFSTVVRSTNGVDIICERPMYFLYTYQGANWAGGHNVMGFVP
jgi:hypothetical protein